MVRKDRPSPTIKGAATRHKLTTRNLQLLGFMIVGSMLLFTVQALGELAVLYPVNGAFFTYGCRFIDEAWYASKSPQNDQKENIIIIYDTGALLWDGTTRSVGLRYCHSKSPLLVSPSLSGETISTLVFGLLCSSSSSV